MLSRAPTPRQGHEQCGGSPSLSLIWKKNVLFFSSIEEIKFNTWGLFNLPICPVRGPGPLR